MKLFASYVQYLQFNEKVFAPRGQILNVFDGITVTSVKYSLWSVSIIQTQVWIKILPITMVTAFKVHSTVLHCASQLRIILRVISAHALKNGGFFFAA